MIKKIPRKTFLLAHPLFPKTSPQGLRHFFPDDHQRWILTTSAADYKNYFHNIAIAFETLIKEVEETSLFFGTDTNISWLRSDAGNRYAKEGIKYFTGIGVDRNYKAALEVPVNDLPAFVKALTGLIRINEILPYIYFMNDSQTLVGFFCQYGNLHLSALTPAMSASLGNAFKAAGLYEINTERCTNLFGNSSIIEGRQAAGISSINAE